MVPVIVRCMTTRIDCDTCLVRGLACHDCVVTVLLGAEPGALEMDETEAAALGAEVKIPTLGGASVTLKLPAGTPNGHTVMIFHGNNFAGFYFGNIIEALRKVGLTDAQSGPNPQVVVGIAIDKLFATASAGTTTTTTG